MLFHQKVSDEKNHHISGEPSTCPSSSISVMPLTCLCHPSIIPLSSLYLCHPSIIPLSSLRHISVISLSSLPHISVISLSSLRHISVMPLSCLPRLSAAATHCNPSLARQQLGSSSSFAAAVKPARLASDETCEGE